MKKLIQLSFLLSFISFSAFSQTDNYELVSADEPFILLTNDSLLFESDFTIDKRLFQTIYYKKNGDEIKGGEIKFIGMDSELYGYFYFDKNGVTHSHTERVGIRKEIGRLDLYQTLSSDGRSRSVSYSRRFEGLKPLKYNFLKEDLLSKDSPDYEQRNALVLEYLDRGLKKKKSGFAIMGGGFVAFMIGAAIVENSERSIVGWSLSLSGLTSMIVGLKRTTKEKEIYLEAVRAYNRF